MSRLTISTRTAWIFLAACLLFEAGSVTDFLAAAGSSFATLNDPARLLATGVRGADLVRSASLLDMLGYLAAVPIALYLRQRYREEPGIDFFTLAGILFMVLGALGAVIFAYGGATLIREYATSTSGRYADAKTFETLYRVVFYGIWQTLDPFLWGVWAFGVGWLAWKRSDRLLAVLLTGLGLIGAVFAIAHISGLYPGS